jgi:hypothetical protein
MSAVRSARCRRSLAVNHLTKVVAAAEWNADQCLRSGQPAAESLWQLTSVEKVSLLQSGTLINVCGEVSPLQKVSGS